MQGWVKTGGSVCGERESGESSVVTGGERECCCICKVSVVVLVIEAPLCEIYLQACLFQLRR